MGAGLRPGAKATEQPPVPDAGAPVPDSTPPLGLAATPACPKRLIVEIVRQRPGQTRRRRPFQAACCACAGTRPKARSARNGADQPARRGDPCVAPARRFVKRNDRSRPGMSRPASGESQRRREDGAPSPYHLSAPRSINPCAGGPSAFSLRVPSRSSSKSNAVPAGASRQPSL